MSNKTRVKLAALFTAVSLAACTVPAYATSTPSPSSTSTPAPNKSVPAPSTTPAPAETPGATPAPTPAAPEGIIEVGGVEMEALADKYSSLSGALVWYYAGQQNLSIGGYMEQNPAQAASLLGLQNTQQLAALPANLGTTPDGVQDLGTLNNQLSAAGLSLDSSAYSDLDSYATAVASQAGSVDAAVIQAGAQWAQELGNLRVAPLEGPGLPGVDASIATKMPTEGLVFGMFLDKSLTTMVTDYPDVFSQIQSSGLGSPESTTAWSASMQKAFSASQADYSTMLPSQSGAALLAAMSSGDPKAASKLGIKGQGSCVTAGLYMNSQMNRLFAPTAASTTTNNADKLLSSGEYNNLQEWQKNLVQQQNPSLTNSLQQSMGSGTTDSGCTAASTATKNAVGVTLPGVFSNLTK